MDNFAVNSEILVQDIDLRPFVSKLVYENMFSVITFEVSMGLTRFCHVNVIIFCAEPDFEVDDSREWV